ncbi:GGDEF domain-containing protein [Acidimicrobium ferrooxidans]|nr:diguanylate cyclase [Acidimicrobium ferrooxidans]
MRRFVDVVAAVLGLAGVLLGVLGTRTQVANDGLLGSLVGALGIVVLLVAGARRLERRQLGHDKASTTGGERTMTQSAASSDLEVVVDRETGLMNAAFFAGLLPTKLATARRRLWPLSIVLMRVMEAEGEASAEGPATMAGFATSVLETIRAADVACRVGGDTVALVLDDTDEDGAAWVAERVQIQAARSGNAGIAKVCCGVAAYPSHGIEADELLAVAHEALARSVAEAEGPGLGPVIVAPTRPL